MLDDFRGALERTHFAHSGHIVTVPLDPELEVFVRVDAASVYRELWHLLSLRF
jgi:hypothetical protein